MIQENENEFEMDPNSGTDPQNNEEIPEKSDTEEVNDEDLEDYEIESADNDSGDEYGSSGEKYGWYNGFSDDAIDDAFEGDPENTWNVD